MPEPFEPTPDEIAEESRKIRDGELCIGRPKQRKRTKQDYDDDPRAMTIPVIRMCDLRGAFRGC